jgi:hypothetical protein
MQARYAARRQLHATEELERIRRETKLDDVAHRFANRCRPTGSSSPLLPPRIRA